MNIDRVIIAGRITQPFDLRFQGDRAVITLPMVVNKWVLLPDGTRQAKAIFLDVSVFGPSAQKAHERLRVGSEVIIEGHHQNREFMVEGKTVNTLCVVADNIHWSNRSISNQPQTP